MVMAYDTRSAVPAGLCTSCRHAAECVLRSENAVAIWHCEELEFAPAQSRVALEVAAPVEPVPHNDLPGLCGSCAVAAICTFPAREHGVWHCEEFE